MATVNNRLKLYQAKCFMGDCCNLMREFIDKESVEFRDFASLWRKHHFSLVFWGRPDPVEACEFTNEMFRIVTQYLFENEYYRQVGAIYLLYALYRNQILDPPARIRITKKILDVIITLRNEAIEKKYRTLHYCIDFMFDNAFDFVANQTLRGPMIESIPGEKKEIINRLKHEYKDFFNDYSQTHKLHELRDISKEYHAEKMKVKKLITNGDLELDPNVFSTKPETIQNLVKEFDDYVWWENNREGKCNELELIRGARRKPRGNQEKLLLTKSSSKKVSSSNKDKRNQKPVEPPKKAETKQRPRKEEKKVERPRKEDRRPGRPSRKPKDPPPPPVQDSSDDEEVDINRLIAEQKDLFLPSLYEMTGKRKSVRDPYYKVSPERKTGVSSTSDSDWGEPDD